MRQPFHQSLMGNSSSEAWKSAAVPVGSNYKLVFSPHTTGGPSHMARRMRTKRQSVYLDDGKAFGKFKATLGNQDWTIPDGFADPNWRGLIFQPSDFKV